MPKSVDSMTEQIFSNCGPPSDLNPECETKIKNYIRQHLEAIKRGAISVPSLVDDRFAARMSLTIKDKSFLDRINMELVRASTSNADQDTEPDK